MDPRTELLRRMRDIRARIDPDVLARAEAAARGEGLPPADGSVPFDKDTARTAVMKFLQARSDGGKFAVKLMEEMKKPEQPIAPASKPVRPTVIVKRSR